MSIHELLSILALLEDPKRWGSLLQFIIVHKEYVGNVDCSTQSFGYSSDVSG